MDLFFYDMQSQCEAPILMVNGEYGTKPSVGDYVLINENKYKVTGILIDYKNGKIYVSLN